MTFEYSHIRDVNLGHNYIRGIRQSATRHIHYHARNDNIKSASINPRHQWKWSITIIAFASISHYEK